jgi:hypothetical protein
MEQSIIEKKLQSANKRIKILSLITISVLAASLWQYLGLDDIRQTFSGRRDILNMEIRIKR